MVRLAAAGIHGRWNTGVRRPLTGQGCARPQPPVRRCDRDRQLADTVLRRRGAVRFRELSASLFCISSRKRTAPITLKASRAIE